MIITEIVGNLSDFEVGERSIDLLEMEWFEATKKIQRRRTNGGKDIAIKFLREGQQLRQEDVLYQDEHELIVVQIKPCDAIVLTPETMLEMGTICYEIGNKHLPLFIHNNKIMMPFEMPMFRWLEGSGYKPNKENVQLLNLLKSNVEPHGHGGSTLFSKILSLASTKE